MNNDAFKKELKIFNYIGGTLIFLGISFFIANNWGILSNFTKIFSTLGTAIAAFIMGLLFHATKKYAAASSAFFMLAALLLPIGLQITLNISKVSWSSETSNLLIATLCFAVFLISQLYSPRTLFLLFTVIFGSLFYISVIDFIAYRANFIYTYLYNYEMIALGFSYIFFGYYLDKNYNYSLVGPLYFFGGLFVLADSFSLGSHFMGYAVPQWEIITPILIIFAFILSVPLRSKSFLYLGAIFLILYICDISTKFIRIFGDIGWALILIMLGLLLMSIGYIVIFINLKINKMK